MGGKCVQAENNSFKEAFKAPRPAGGLKSLEGKRLAFDSNRDNLAVSAD